MISLGKKETSLLRYILPAPAIYLGYTCLFWLLVCRWPTVTGRRWCGWRYHPGVIRTSLSSTFRRRHMSVDVVNEFMKHEWISNTRIRRKEWVWLRLPVQSICLSFRERAARTDLHISTWGIKQDIIADQYTHMKRRLNRYEPVHYIISGI